MSAIDQEIQQLRNRNRELARNAILAVEALKREPSPMLLQEIQDEIRSGLLAIESRLRVVEKTRKRWRKVAKKRFKEREILRAHSERVAKKRVRDDLLHTQRDILKQIGDSCAWIVLNGNPRVLGLLYSENRNHHLPSDVGLVGTLSVAESANKSGRFFALENDLTRILSIGDLTVVPSSKQWAKPLVLEVKSTGEFRIGGHLEIRSYTSIAELTPDGEAFEELADTLGQEIRDADPSSNAEEQVRLIKERSDLLLNLDREMVRRLGMPRNTLWPALTNVLAKAGQYGTAYDLAEEKVVLLAIRTSKGAESARALYRELGELNLAPASKRFAASSSDDLQKLNAVAPFALPIPLWPIPVDQRIALLTRDLFYACLYDPEVWEAALEKHSIHLVREEGRWVLTRNNEVRVLDVLEIMRIIAGLPFSGMSPREFANIVEDGFTNG